MKTLLALLAIVALTGCSSTGGGRSFSYSQSPQFNADLRSQHVAAYDYMGKVALNQEHHAEQWAINAKWCRPEGVRGPLGPYSCSPCTGAGSTCVHATAGLSGDHSAAHTYAGDPVPDTVLHECLHPFLQQYADNPAELNVWAGHPDYVTIGGQRFTIRQLMYRPVRWPLSIDAPVRWVQMWFPWDEPNWTDVECDNGTVTTEEEIK